LAALTAWRHKEIAMQYTTIDQFLTDSEIRLAEKLWQQYRLDGTGQFATAVREQVIEPNMDRINRRLGQENDARYLAYAVEYALLQSAGKRKA
jgi:hypothetical protein